MFRAWHLAELIPLLDGQLLGADVQVRRVHTDTRSLRDGDLFVALTGDTFDGHDYLPQAEAAGAAAALVDAWQDSSELPQLAVGDTRVALGLLGRHNRAQFKGTLIALTGSSGKTTVKELLASIGGAAVGAGAVLATKGNLNNEIGVPLTLLELEARHQLAVIELGASLPGEIAWTRSLAQPQVVLINNAGMAHAGEFGGPEHIVRAKGEILDDMHGQGVAVLNLDDAAFAQWRERSSASRVLSFAVSNEQADVYARDASFEGGCARFTLCTPAGSARVQLQLAGAHNLANALAAAATAHAAGIALEAIVQGLQQAQPVAGRCLRHALSHGGVLIDDSYNANPASMRAGMDLLESMPGQRILVLGDMGELGEWAEAEHGALGEYANGKADVLFAVGPHMQHAVSTFNGMAQHFASREELLATLASRITLPTSYLVKGSRSAAMEQAVAAILQADKETD
ncbi:UDP-N-acetylmuramoyl-tripeptide--D-alanyl-D-alanine ligase [Thiopseudomonas denitrificans]|uniref:UDP-N-acetylmuramoyl-tripeptide--D-alanyl-D-alanine ligase n=1 Tax=Thiopseudomonas denitrificans TaxID=1501432 RepID=A0A4R6TZV0_9GAMM|nr:UDP-N-acetylmuramoyl-tripeptide--D-alanyl-D-alanine ligase [Thiopseudomonas denitrificans]TDQ38906.1 UDP-N-acetylmuramoyl-tripeptide--D-alanyl-D-alanine ligase [Thiopseudomonas denitrificans]